MALFDQQIFFAPSVSLAEEIRREQVVVAEVRFVPFFRYSNRLDSRLPKAATKFDEGTPTQRAQKSIQIAFYQALERLARPWQPLSSSTVFNLAFNDAFSEEFEKILLEALSFPNAVDKRPWDAKIIPTLRLWLNPRLLFRRFFGQEGHLWLRELAVELRSWLRVKPPPQQDWGWGRLELNGLSINLVRRGDALVE